MGLICLVKVIYTSTLQEYLSYKEIKYNVDIKEQFPGVYFTCITDEFMKNKTNLLNGLKQIIGSPTKFKYKNNNPYCFLFFSLELLKQ